jgi:hypothetical protein
VRRDPKGRWGLPAGPSAVLVPLTALLVTAVLATGCTTGDAEEPSGTPKRELAVRPEALPTGAAATASATAGATPGTSTAPAGSTTGPGTSTSKPPTGAPGPAGPGTPPPAPPGEGPYRGVGTLTDPRNDHGSGGPAYADVRGVLLEDDGTRLRATVTMGGPLPGSPAASEALGIGVDLYDKAGEFESDYQLFADGGPDGWFAYLHTPKGFVRYPGRFALGGSTLVFTVPWSAVGGRRDGQFKAFADWTRGDQGGTLGGNATSNDRAPLVGTTRYDRG